MAFASSAGGIQALSTVLSGPPAEFAVPVLVVQHLDPRHDTVLADLLNLRTALHVALATDGEALAPGTVRLAPPDRHPLIDEDHRLALDDGPPVNYVRPSADRLFASAAEAFGAGVLACVLTGSGHDGTAGARAVKGAGGVVLAQDPATAAFPSMPRAVCRRRRGRRDADAGGVLGAGPVPGGRSGGVMTGRGGLRMRDGGDEPEPRPGSALEPAGSDQGLEELLAFIRDARGFGFTGTSAPRSPAGSASGSWTPGPRTSSTTGTGLKPTPTSSACCSTRS